MKHTLVLALALAAGCSFNPGNSSTDLSTTGGDDLAGGDDMTSGPDLTVVCTAGVKTCSGTTLSTCNLDGTAVDTATCVLGCNTAGNDCNALSPTAPAVSSDFAYGGLSDPTIAASQTLLIFDTDSGEIRDGAGAVVRMPNAAPQTRFVENGIGFHRVSGVGIWTFSKLTVPATATIVFKSAFAASILSATDLTIAGTIDLRGYATPSMAPATLCLATVAGPGGAAGGIAAAAGTGAGGAPTDTTGGGGGGGYGLAGGIGGKHGGAQGTVGPVTGSAAINPLAGGFGGGSSSGLGGGGGGALQLAAEGTITISGTINAGGCGGGAGNVMLGGGGGGSGGAILVEAPTVHITSAGILTANGGGGGGGGDAAATAGIPGRNLASPANGGSGATNGFNGGNGGAGATAAQPGVDGNGAGGGGGGVGRVRLNSRTGTATIDGTPVLSPTVSQGTVTIQ